MRPTAVISLVALAAVAAPADAQRRATFPIEPGLTWTYRGYVRWTGADRTVHGDSITWTTKIVAARTEPEVRAALVVGWIQELAWYQPSKKPQYSVVIERSGQLYHATAQDSAAAAQLVEAVVLGGVGASDVSDLVLGSTFVVGAVYGRDSITSKHDDNMYRWYVGSERVVAAPAAWKTAARVRRVTLERRTLPDYQSIDVVPGVGITRFVYSHHGTVAEADVRLVSVTRQKGGRR